MSVERCCECDEPTGKAGRGDGSLYTERGGNGPYCEACFPDTIAENHAALLAAAKLAEDALEYLKMDEHHPGCFYEGDEEVADDDCDCGWQVGNAALAALRPLVSK